MDGAASTPASAEDDSSGVGAVDMEPRRPAASPIIVPEDGNKEGQRYVDLLLRASLLLLRKGYAPGVRHQGLKLILHLLKFRWEELRIEEWSAGKHNLFVAPDLGVVASAVNHASIISSIEKGNVGALPFDSDDICNEIMDVSSKRILQKSAAMSPELLELSRNEPPENNGFIEYCSILLDLIRFIAHERPIIAVSRAVGSINYLIGDASVVSEYSKDLAANRSAELVLETVVSTIFDDSTKFILDTEFSLQRVYKIFEGLILQLLSLKWTEPGLVVIMRFYLNALCPFLRHFPDAVTMVVTKLLELLSSINNFHDPSTAQHARLQICQCIIHICQAVDRTSLPPDVKDLFSVPQITEEAVIAFVATSRATRCMEQKQVGGEGNGDAVHPSFASCSIPSPPSSYLTLRRRPWILNDENIGLSSLSCFHDLPTTQPSFDSSSAPSLDKSNHTLSQKKLDHNIIPCTQLYNTSFPLHGSLPISWLRLGAKSQSRNEGKILNLHPKHQISTESCSSSLVCSSSPCLPLVKQRQQLHPNEEHRTLVSSLTQVGKSQPTNIFDQGISQEQHTVHGIVMGDVEGSSEFVDERNLGIVGSISCLQDKGQLLLLEHNILSEAFFLVTSFHRIQDMHHLLTDLLSTLNKIRIQSDWEYKIMHCINHVFGVFTNHEFRRTVRLLVKSFEELIGSRSVESPGAQKGYTSAYACDMYSYTLAKLMLPLILWILRCIQMLWKEPITYNLSGVNAEDISSVLESGKLHDVDESKMLQNAETWSQEIQEIGYNVIGLCASVEGAFYGLLDCSYIINVIMGNLECMKFNHLGKLIQIVFIPLVKYCPCECWGEWMLQLLRPLFYLCEDGLYYAWFTFLNEGLAKVPQFLGIPKGPEEIVHQFKKQLLLKITVSVSELLGVLGSERLNSGLSPFHPRPNHHTKAGVQDLMLLSNASIIGYLLLHNCFERLSMYLLGCLVDYEAVEKASPFCYALIRLAIATNHGGLNHFILFEMLPTIMLLVGDIPSATSKLSCSLTSATKKDARKKLIQLCNKIYEVYIDNQVMEGEGVDSKDISDRFNGWLVKELYDLHICAASAAPEDFPHDVWNWEFNEEFERYLPTYINMLVQVDALDDCLEVNYLNMDTLLEKLEPEFKSMYGISSCTHPYLRIMFNILARKRSAVYHERRVRWISQYLTQLVTLKPYIECTDSCDDILERLPEICESQYDPMQWSPAGPIDIFCGSVLFFREPKFHPLIRESHKELLTTLAHQLALAEGSASFEPFEPTVDDFPGHLQPYAWMYIKRMKEESGYSMVKEQACLHEEFDNYLASGILDNHMDDFNCSKDDFVRKVASDLISEFAKLQHDLIKMSLERRAKIVDWEHQVFSYSEYLESLLTNDKMKDELGNLMNLLNEKGFFRVDSMDWDNKLFSESIKKFSDVVFAGQRVDKCLVIRGIIDYHEILQMKDVDSMDAFRRVVNNTNYLWKENVQQFWVTTRHYEHDYYDTLARPLQKVFLLHGALKPKYDTTVLLNWQAT